MTHLTNTPERRVRVTYTVNGVFGNAQALLHVLKDDSDAEIKRHLKQRVKAEFDKIGFSDVTDPLSSLIIYEINDFSL